LPGSPDYGKKFAAVVARKTREAREAEIPGFELVVDHSDAFDTVPVADVPAFGGRFVRLKARERLLPAVDLVFVESADENVLAKSPADLGGGASDRHVVYEGFTRLVDAVMVGSNSIDGTDLVLSCWHPTWVRLREARAMPRHPAQIVLTLKGGLNFRTTLVLNAPDLEVFVVTTNGGIAAMAPEIRKRPWLKAVSEGEEPDLRGALVTLKQAFGINTISAIGGRIVARQLLRGGLVDGLYLTTSAIRAGYPDTPLLDPAEPVRLELVQEFRGRGPEEGVRFRYFAVGDAPAGLNARPT
jgi:riboflavin biosynthesis pyrimidine reductase